MVAVLLHAADGFVSMQDIGPGTADEGIEGLLQNQSVMAFAIC